LLRGGKVTKVYGCGAHACVWKKGNRILKITDDDEDVGAAVRAKGLRHVRRYHKLYLLKSPQERRWYDRWAMIGDDVTPVEDSHQPFGQWIAKYGWGIADDLADKLDYFGLKQHKSRRVIDRKCRYLAQRNVGHRRCRQFGRQYVDTWIKLARRGIRFKDNHSGNFGVTPKGTWKIIDLGVSGSEIPPGAVETLRAPRWRRLA
jgi:hypothetical protein